MLICGNLFGELENALIENGTIEKFEKKNGKVKGRMMITLADIPNGIDVEENEKHLQAFECSFDFLDVTFIVVVNTHEQKTVSSVWINKQKPDAEEPDKTWMDFFLKTLSLSFFDDGSYSCPLYTFLNDSADFTVVPDFPNDEALSDEEATYERWENQPF